MSTPTEKPFEPTREQIAEVIKKLPAMCPDWAARWHLIELNRELSTLRSQLDAMNQEVQVEIGFKVQAREQSESLKLKVEELRGVILTLHSQLDAIKAEVVKMRAALRELYAVYYDMPGCSLIAISRDRFERHKHCLTHAAMEVK